MLKDRAVCLNCIDGRVQLPVINWIKEKYKVDFVDMITEPGMDGAISKEKSSLDEIIRKTKISIEVNSAKTIVIVGHHDCRGNPISEPEHKQQIKESVKKIKEVYVNLNTIGIWVSEQSEIEIVVQ